MQSFAKSLAEQKKKVSPTKRKTLAETSAKVSIKAARFMDLLHNSHIT